MADTGGRRRRGRRKVRYEEVLPSTDLPPLVQGDLRCFLVVDIGKINWSSTATAQVPPASPAYVRLRWWGETSEGTLFKPWSSKNEKPVKCRCRFGIRSGAKQMSAYFVDMGSILFEVLTSPKSVPLGRIQIPKVANLTSSNPIRDFFPIYSPSSRKIGELEIHVRFESLEGAYDLTTDTGTDTSMSSRSRPPSEIDRRSRSRGSSIGSRSNRGSARSRSSSTGSRKSNSKKRSTSRSKGRRRSRSTESNASSASKRSQTIKKASTIDSSTPRGIDDLLQQNGLDLYGLGSKPPRKTSAKSVGNENEEAEPKKQDASSSLQQDAISVLLHRGNQLREDILKSQFETNMPKCSALDAQVTAKPLFEAASKEYKYQLPQATEPQNQPTRTALPSFPKQPKLVTPIKEKRQDLDMRFVDLVFGSQEFKGHPAFLSGIDSHSVSPLSSMISEFEDNPLYDESLLQQMFYNNGVMTSIYDQQRVNGHMRALESKKVQNADKFSNAKVAPVTQPQKSGDRSVQVLADRIPGMSVRRLLDLQKVHCVAVTVETLALNQLEESMLRPKPRKGRGRGGKPPVPSPKGKRKMGTYFVEFRFPETTNLQREHPSSMTTSHDVTRVASRKTTTSVGPIVIFDEHCEFQFHFTDENLLKWAKETLEFTVYRRKPNDKKANEIGVAIVRLEELLLSNDLEFGFDVDVRESHKSVGNLKVTFELIASPYDEEISTPPRAEGVDGGPETVPKQVENDQENPPEMEINAPQGHGSSIALSPSTSVLYMMLMVQEGYNIPGTTVILPRQGMVAHPPNVSLVCRSLTSGESEKTPIVWGQCNPKFDFVQISPLKLDNSLLSRMQNNFIIVEVWTKITSTEPHSDKLLGLAKLPTHHFYQSLKDEEISKVVLNSLHPLISVDEAVPIVDLFTGQDRGQLHITLALGTQAQISTLRKVKSDIQGKRTQQHHLEEKQSQVSDHKVAGPVQHTFEINVVKLNGFKPQNNQVWGETDCFVQYQFPAQKSTKERDEVSEQSDNTENLNLASMQDYRTDATLCVPDPAFNDSRRHTFAPPPSVPVQRILLSCCYSDGMAGGIPFELWSRYYHPNVRDQFLAKGMLPIAKLGALVSMTNKKVSEQTFHIPMEFVDVEQSHDQSAGKLEVHVKYRASGTTLESTQPVMKFSKPVILRVGLLRASGLKAAALAACHRSNNDDLKYCADVGVNTYVEMKPSFLPDEETRTSRIVAQDFAPEYQHHVEIACPLVSYHRDITPISLAELLLSGEMEITVWHRSENSGGEQNDDVLLATLTIPMRSLLHKTTGVHTWFPLKAPESSTSSEQTLTVGGIEISMSFASANDLDLILKAAKATGWNLPPFESRLLNDDVINSDITGTNCVTFSVTVTNAWLPKHEVHLLGRTTIDKSANVYLRYKFFDHDSVTSSLCPLVSKQPHSIDTRFENLTSARIAHKRSFICKKSRPLNWYLREEKLELQIWLTHSSASKKSRPLDSDKLLGSSYLDLSTISDLEKEQHISGSFDIFKTGSEDLGGGQVRVYVSVKPGDIIDPIPDPLPEKALSEEEMSDTLEVSPKLSEKSSNDFVFLAVVTVERAMHLPQVGDLETDKFTEPNSFVSYEVVNDAMFATEARDLKMVAKSTKISITAENPVWNNVQEVALPRHLLTGTHGALLLKVWHRDRLYLITPDQDGSDQPKSSEFENELMATDRMLGFATVDLSVLRAGLRDVNGWYNILDIHGQCQGQLKVAVTPKNPPEVSQPSIAISQPSKARSDGSSQKISTPPQTQHQLAPKIMNFLHQAPLDIPVQTPSGSMYIPGLPNSAQTVGTTCKMSESEEANFLRKTRENAEDYTRKFSEDFSQKLNVGRATSNSMFRYATSDRQQACLVNTLEKQIQELEGIKKKFEERRAGGFNKTTHDITSVTAKTQSDTIQHHEELSEDNPSVQNIPKRQNFHPHFAETPTSNAPPQYRTNDTVLKLHPNMTLSFEALPNLEVLPPQSTHLGSIPSNPPPTSGTPEGAKNFVTPSSTQPKSVHLSLYQPQKNTDFDDRALSDNEVNSDLEFIQPRSLNESMCSDFVEKPPQSEKNSKKPPHAELRHHRLPEPTVPTPIVTPGRSEGQSMLDDTSLWLTGSTLRVSGFSSDEEQDKETPRSKGATEILDVSQGFTPPHTANSTTLSSQDERIVTPLEEIQQDADSESAASSDEDLGNSEEEVEEDPHQDGKKEDDVPTESGDDLSRRSEDGHHHRPVLVVEEEKSLQDADALVRHTENTDLEEEKVVPPEKIVRTESESSSDGSTTYEKKISSPEPTAMTFEPTHPRSTDDEESTAPKKFVNDENHCPNPSFQSQRCMTTNQKHYPKFFPSSHNLEASMRALQEATLKHKHDLLKKREASSVCENISPEKQNSQPRPKKVPPKPTDFSDEKTKRLARIFRTKFSS